MNNGLYLIGDTCYSSSGRAFAATEDGDVITVGKCVHLSEFSEQESSQRLDSFNRVKLYDSVIRDLKLKQGDLVIFIKNEQGHWEVRTEHEIIKEIDDLGLKK